MAGTSLRTQSRENAAEQLKNNPCHKEQQLSMKCLDDNGYDYDKCQHYFDNFKACKGFWVGVMRERRRNGIKPVLPPPEEREAIKAEHLKRQSRKT
ncbi:coiled-coil-helix-coiled-coil-helix domain-containing protein 7 isoform X2 [Amblyomma americanum]|uniref:Coiled-coil-helix-coiled-coil-helix domain-containing protein 7 n=1 Tax=Amblyomma americanum TaxID=6943 RepID=A0AAQ4FAY9_AMBAM